MLMETVVQMFLAWMMFQAIQGHGKEAYEQMLIAATGSGAYMVSSLFAGRWVKPKFAPYLLIGVAMVIGVLGITCLVFDSFILYFPLTFLIGGTLGHYYVPFQINMSHVKPFNTLAWSIACYNIAWGVGAALGPFTGALYRQSHWMVLSSFAVVVIGVHTVLNIVALYAPKSKLDHETHAAFESSLYQRIAGWSSYAIAGMFLRGVSFVLIPKLAQSLKWSDSQSAIALVAIYLPISTCAPVWAKLRYRLERQNVHLVMSVIGLLSYCSLYFTTEYMVIVVCMFLLGMANSCSVFHSLYYANAAPDRVRSKGVGLSEAVAGWGNFGGPLLMGLLIWKNPFAPRIYIVGGIAYVLLIGIIVICARRHHADPKRQTLKIG